MSRPHLGLVWSWFACAALSPAVAGAADVKDGGSMFGEDAEGRARAALGRIERDHRVPVVIETVGSLGGASIDAEARRRAQGSGINGLFILMAREERKISDALAHRAHEGRLSAADRSAIREAFLGPFRAADFDGGLARGVEAIATKLGSSPPGAATVTPAAAPGKGAGAGGFGPGTYLLIGLGIIGVLILLRAVGGAVRGPRPAPVAHAPSPAYPYGPSPMDARPGPYSGHPGGYAPAGGGSGPGYGPPPAGGGAMGGFASGLAGGLGGALAGNYLHDRLAGDAGGENASAASALGEAATATGPGFVGGEGASWGEPGGDWAGGEEAGWGGGGEEGSW